MRKKMVTTGLALGLVAGVGAGLALDIAGNAGAAGNVTATATAPADPTTPTTTPADPSTPDTTPVAPAAPADAPRPDPGTKLQETLQPLIDNGTITQAQADAVIAALEAARPAGRPGGGGGPGRGMGHPGDVGASLDVVASTIGISVDDLRTAMQAGTSIADIATAHGKTADEVIAAVVADRTTKINAQVAAGTITQAQADERLADLQQRVTDLVNNTRQARDGRKFPGPPPTGAESGTGAAGTTTGT